MHPIRWVPEDTTDLLDVGCNVGDLLKFCGETWPALRLAGVEINSDALERARQSLPGADLRLAGADALPFPDESFDCVTCIEVLEHVPAARRRRAVAEMWRVLRRGGRLVLRVPHAGAFAWLDPDNFRFRFPGLYRCLVGRGRKDIGYADKADGVVWHHHFTRAELLDLAGDGWAVAAIRRGALLLTPLAMIAAWPLFRMRRIRNPLFRALMWLSEFDMGLDFGRASYDILLILQRR
jgi:SAM-dependent methyltransferase